ncbi:hypothetical protein RIF29_39223 [Crotalaria pallida]|uniref:Uncharacterized protein n=1 Tax=Crotalaria pallida TaxID=3830 RepID=A0AAN9E723_CROPI
MFLSLIVAAQPSRSSPSYSKNREKRRWIFRKNHETVNTQQTPTKLKHDVAAAAATSASVVVASRTDQDQKHALAMAVATAEAAMATAQAAVEVARLSKPSTTTSTTSTNHNARDHYAAIVIQIAFRGYLVSTTNRSIVICKFVNPFILVTSLCEI